MLSTNGDRAPKTRRERLRLAPRAPLIESVLAGNNLDGVSIEAVRGWGNALLAARQQWADANRNGRRYTDRDEAKARNSLVRRGGGA